MKNDQLFMPYECQNFKMKSNTADPMTEIPFFKFYIKVMFYFWREAGMHIYTTPNSKYTPKNNWF